MLALLAILALAQSGPGPMDAFRANYAAIKVDLEYDFRKGGVDAAVVTNGRLWKERDSNFVGLPHLAVIGQWSCDGEVERYHFSSPKEVIEEGKKQPRELGKALPYIPEHEGLWDGAILAGYILHEDEIMMDRDQLVVWNDREPGFLSMGKGPFFWWISYPFPLIVQTHFPGVTPVRRKAERGGHLTEVEIYRRSLKNDGWHQIEVAYDPAVGYLPRYARMTAVVDEKRGWVKETYLIEARPCAAGGFVPTEWYDLSYGIDDFDRHYPDYNDDTVLAITERASMGHFKVTSMKDRATPVTLTLLQNVHKVGTPGGGWVPLRPGTRFLTLPQIKSALGTRLTNPKPAVLPTLDVAEMQQFSSPPPVSVWRSYLAWLPYLLGALTAVAFVGFLVARRRGWSLLMLLGLIGLSGCSTKAAPVVKLSAAFTEPHVLYDIQSTTIPLTLLVRNEGNQTLRLFKADGGCACRQVDQSHFPTSLAPSGSLSLAVSVNPGKQSLPQTLRVTFESDRGSIPVPVSLHVLPRHQLSPEAPSGSALNEDAEWTIEIVHRAIHGAEDAPCEAELRAPEPRFTVRKVGVSSSRVAAAPEFVYQDTTYHVTLVDRSFGLQKSILLLEDRANERLLLEAPIVWQRVPFLSSLPDRVALGAHPTRVFLRCPDESVELTGVISAPEGVKAVVSSTRELTVLPKEAVPGTIDGTIVVGTTAADRPPLRIPVVRYAPPLARN